MTPTQLDILRKKMKQDLESAESYARALARPGAPQGDRTYWQRNFAIYSEDAAALKLAIEIVEETLIP